MRHGAIGRRFFTGGNRARLELRGKVGSIELGRLEHTDDGDGIGKYAPVWRDPADSSEQSGRRARRDTSDRAARPGRSDHRRPEGSREPTFLRRL